MVPNPAKGEPKGKRKAPAPSSSGLSTSRGVKRVKLSDARQIRSEPPHKSLNEHNELDVASFVKAHENEIANLEASIGVSKKALSTRAFQSVPRELRRRTASHNVKKVPKRLRNRAAKEMREDNTPTVQSRTREKSSKTRLRTQGGQEKIKALRKHTPDKNGKDGTEDYQSGGATDLEKDGAQQRQRSSRDAQLASPQVTVPKFRKRQIHKAWLPTHIWHTKRAHMTDHQRPLWRFAIPLSPTEKSYRTTHRASTLRGCVAWDTSYMSTISAYGNEKSLLGLLRCLSVPEIHLTQKQGDKWRRGLRHWSGWLKMRDDARTLIAPAAVVWDSSRESSDKRKLLIRVHPSAFYQLWNEVCKVAKIQKPTVKVEDLRFEIGSIEVAGPAATEAVVSVLSLIDEAEETSVKWSLLAGVNDVKTVPPNALLKGSMADPRLGSPHQTAKTPSTAANQDRLLQILAEWPFDNAAGSTSLLDSDARSEACRLLPSQKSINRRKGEADPGKHPSALPTDPKIPFILLSTNASSVKSPTGSWTLLLPWKCVLPFWYSLVHYPVSSGQNPRMGGLDEQRQLSFETGAPWFPADFPGTKAGWEWEMIQREQRKANWQKRPKGKRVEWNSLELGTDKKGELGDGWACHWESLLPLDKPQPAVQQNTDQSSMEVDVLDQDGPVPDADLAMPFGQYAGSKRVSLSLDFSRTTLVTICVSLANRGHAGACARIYRLPSTDTALRQAWMALATSQSQSIKRRTAQSPQAVSRTANVHEPRSALIAALLADTHTDGRVSKDNAAESSHPHVPGEEDLVGFVTAGNYNLVEGRSTAIGSILLARMVKDIDNNRKHGVSTGLCIVRDAGMSVGRLAEWTVV
jgi:ribonuclease P/MRP protein subunit POP1